MAGGEGGAGERSLQETPTWAVAVVCSVFVILSVLIEHGIHSLGKWFQKKQKKAMNEALEKIKSELMLLGFLSLLLTFGTNYIKKICIPHSIGDTMLPCKKVVSHGGDGRRHLLSFETEDDNDVLSWRRILATSISGDDYCSTKGKVPLISASGLHQLHIFIFVLAVSHIFYSVMTMVLSQAKMKKWKSWEAETSSLEYQFSNDPARFRLAHQTSFVKQHSGWSRMPGIRWIVAFFRQFFASVTKVDYMTMRHGFINAHLGPNSKFNFHKYIKRSMEDDFKVVVGISMPLWVSAIIFLLLNVYKWNTLTWLSFIPLVILLLVGTKLELIIMEMAQEIQDRTTIVRGVPVVEPNNKYFWFNRPQWILFLIHFTLFQNAFQIALFLWTVYEFKIKSCFHENLKLILIRVILGVFLQFICSYITFPLYALITQMGSHMKKAIFEEQTAKAIKKWQKTAKDRTKLRKAGMDNVSNSGYMSGETTPSQGTSPIHLLHKYKPSSDHTDTESVLYSPRSYPSDTELSETELAYTHHHRIQLNEITTSHGHGPPNNRQETHNVDFSFDKP
ncbi:MLO protein homolog 1-like isoform X1 [Arachis duranensis]|uniref:MLO-like protein n=1 Tax=Arachis duranensis TaxID=130453 RepID=A0A6P4BR70_ARADU|nr:MLO protein homolog 1-like isoform X1 [Arachis duranensis]